MRAGWMRPSCDQLLERQLRDLAPHAVERGQDDRRGRVVDDEVDAGDVLERADVAPLAADDPALHVVATAAPPATPSSPPRGRRPAAACTRRGCCARAGRPRGAPPPRPGAPRAPPRGGPRPPLPQERLRAWARLIVPDTLQLGGRRSRPPRALVPRVAAARAPRPAAPLAPVQLGQARFERLLALEDPLLEAARSRRAAPPAPCRGARAAGQARCAAVVGPPGAAWRFPSSCLRAARATGPARPPSHLPSGDALRRRGRERPMLRRQEPLRLQSRSQIHLEHSSSGRPAAGACTPGEVKPSPTWMEQRLKRSHSPCGPRMAGKSARRQSGVASLREPTKRGGRSVANVHDAVSRKLNRRCKLQLSKPARLPPARRSYQ